MSTPRISLVKVVGTALGLLVVYFAVSSLADDWSQIAEQGIALDLQPAWLLASAACTLIGFLVLVDAWRRIAQVEEHTSMQYGTAARIWFMSNLGKYLPGKVWAIAGAGVMASREGHSAAKSVVAALVMQLVAAITGGAVGLVLAGELLENLAPETRTLSLVVGIVAFLAVALLASGSFVDFLKRLGGERLERLVPLPPVVLFIAVVATVSAWLLYGFSFKAATAGVLGAGVAPSFAVCTAAFAAAYLIGLVTPIPGGAGVREGALVLLLAGTMPPGTALVASLGSRVVFTLCELAGAAAVAIIRP